MSEKIPNDYTDLMWKTHMKTLMKKARVIETKEIIEKAIWEYYFGRGLDVPNWKLTKDPKWWIDYLEELEKE
jgi:hypothetical protein